MKKNKKNKNRQVSNKQVIMPNALVEGFEHGLPPVTELERTKENFEEYLKLAISLSETEFTDFQQKFIDISDQLAENISVHNLELKAKIQDIYKRIGKLEEEISSL